MTVVHPADAARLALARRERLRSRLRAASLRGAAALMDLTSHGLRRLPQRARYIPADALTLPLAALWPRQTIIERNFATMLNLPTHDPRVKVLARRGVQNFGRMAIDFLTVRTMAPADILRWGTSAGETDFNDAMSEGRGVILALPHVGSWDVGAAFAQARGLKLSVVTESNWATELVAGSRVERGVTLVPRDRGLRLLFRALQRNECVVMLSDLANAGVQTMDVPFFGHPAPFPMGPARLSQHTGAPILVITSVRLPDSTYLIKTDPPLRPDTSRSAEDEVARLTAAVASGFERIIRQYPDQWYAFHPVWPAEAATQERERARAEQQRAEQRPR
ncbi:MAG: lysophospholipid acyltransferase family protein [Ktedonobacterales bacterium]|nr:lysophospholipid acyltransferase family protein [Ktedonobacterales bacterium]